MSKIAPNLVRDSAYGELLQEPMYPNVSQKIDIVGDPNRNSTDFTSVVVEITPTKDCYFALGDDSVTVSPSGETCHYSPANIPRKINTGEATRIAVLNFTSGEIGSLFVTEMV